MNLTAEQIEAAEASAPQVLVEAGPGTGKTATLAARLVHLVRDRKVPPELILALTFTRSAAEEIRSRVRFDLGDLVPTIQTFHTFAASVSLPDGMRIATRLEVEAHERSLYRGPTRRPGRDVPGIKALRRNCAEHEAKPPMSCGSYAGVEILLRRMKAAGLVPLFDLVPSALGSDDVPTFDHVLIDEYQDTTPGELALCRRALDLDGELFAVGCPNQAIMNWRGASGFVGTPTHHLGQSFRFGPAIAAEVNKLADRFGGSHVDGIGDFGIVDEIVLEAVPEFIRRGYGPPSRSDLGDTLILCRTRRECRAMAREIGPGALVGLKPETASEDPLATDADLFASIWRQGLAVVSTVHSAKGREADTVIVALEWDDLDDDEERRVLYVAASRARRHLIFVDPIETGAYR